MKTIISLIEEEKPISQAWLDRLQSIALNQEVNGESLPEDIKFLVGEFFFNKLLALYKDKSLVPKISREIEFRPFNQEFLQPFKQLPY